MSFTPLQFGPILTPSTTPPPPRQPAVNLHIPAMGNWMDCYENEVYRRYIKDYSINRITQNFCHNRYDTTGSFNNLGRGSESGNGCKTIRNYGLVESGGGKKGNSLQFKR